MRVRSVIASLRPGWSRHRPFALVAAIVRAAVVVFALHVSGAAHLLADVLLEDDMTCADELAHKPHGDSTAPKCPAAQGFACGQGAVTPEAAKLEIQAPQTGDCPFARERDAIPPSIPRPPIERPPRA